MFLQEFESEELEVPRQGVAPDPSVRRTAPGFVKLNSGFRSAGCSLATFVRDSGAQSLHGSNFVCNTVNLVGVNCPLDYRAVWNAGGVDLLYCKYSIFTVQAVSSIIPGGVARAPNRNILYLLYGHYTTSKRTVAGSIPDSGIFRKRF